MASIRCEACGRIITGLVTSGDWEGGMCDECWSMTSPITRSWFAISQRNGDASGWPERYVTEHNITWDVLVAQARIARDPPPARKERDPRRVVVDMGKAGRPRGGYAAQLQRIRSRGR